MASVHSNTWAKDTAGYISTSLILNENIPAGGVNAVDHYTEWFSFGVFGDPHYEFTLCVNHTLAEIGTSLQGLSFKMYIEYKDRDGMLWLLMLRKSRY